MKETASKLPSTIKTYSIGLAGYLALKGHKVHLESESGGDRYCWTFTDSPEVQDTIKAYEGDTISEYEKIIVRLKGEMRRAKAKGRSRNAH